MPNISVLPEALADIARLEAFLYMKDADAAKKAVNCIRYGLDMLKNMPNIGRPMANREGSRELAIPFGVGAYVLRYKLIKSNDPLKDDAVIIIRVWHSKELKA